MLATCIVSTAFGRRLTDFGGAAVLGIAEELTNPSDVAVDLLTGDLYLADESSNCVTRLSKETSIMTTIAGIASCSGDGGLATSTSLNGPTGLTVDAVRGLLYIADTGNNVIRMFKKGTGAITTVAGTSEIGYSGDGGLATSASMSQPAGTAVDPVTGNLYIADTGNNVIRVVMMITGIITTAVGTGISGYSIDGGPATSAALSSPTGLAYDHVTGNLFIADTGNNVIRMLTSMTGVISTIAGIASSGASYNGNGDGGPAVSASLNMPIGLAVDALKGLLYIADSGNNVIRMVNSAGVITTIAGDRYGRNGFSGDWGPATNALMNRPVSVALDASSGMMYVIYSYNRVTRNAIETSNVSTVPSAAPVFASVTFTPTAIPTSSGEIVYRGKQRVE